ncbi:ABC transporter ATP-binding protein [Thermoplasma sp.]|uniref:ATP-binding cassette domain-containing protein n=1 Tax=Thermoplasma sp. TaxID=1973142 RepID=UPI00126E0BB8|nr:ABC transporter ATP-binding protein [Thermoplasma sp.]KAA8922406.1 MAG: ABC transporter ATP-binding protein [Thermoplasma sp.]
MVSGSVEAIVCRNLTKAFKKRRVLDKVNFALSDGVNVLVGENGAGKSTLFYLISGIMKPDSGIAMLNGIDSWKNHGQAMREVSFMPEKPSVLGGTSVREHIYWFSSLNGTGMERIIDYLHFFQVDYILPATFQSLSLGEMQLVMIACYLSTESSIFIFDEPNSNVDVHKRSLVSEAIRQKADKSNSLFLISTHVLDEMLTIYDRMLVLDKHTVRFSAESGKVSFVSVLRTNNNNQMLASVREMDSSAVLINNAVFTSLEIKRCAEIASENGIVIMSYFLIPAEMARIYE